MDSSIIPGTFSHLFHLNSIMTEVTTYTAETLELIKDLSAVDYDAEDMYDFIEQYGEEDFHKYYEYYVEAGEKHSYEVVDAFIDIFDFADLDRIGDAYLGEYDNVRDYVEQYLESTGVVIPDFVQIDYDSTFMNLEIVVQGNYYFLRNF